MKPKYVASFALGTMLMVLSPVTSFLCLVSLGAYYVASSRMDAARRRPGLAGLRVAQ